MWETWQEMHEPGARRSLREWLHDSQMDLHDIHIGYSSGTFSLQERAWAEQLYLNMCHEVQKQLDPSNRAHRPIIDELQERMADKIYVNFSLFQSMPDAWGIDQLFPVLPLEGLNHAPERRAVLLDITCDSDGAIDHYVDGDGIATTMPMPEYDPENPPMLGFFMVGAYQEILGNMHNLFGDTEAVDVFVFPDGSVEVELSDEGDTVADMLEYVQLDPKALLTQFRDQVKQQRDLDEALQPQFLEEFESGSVRLHLSGRRVSVFPATGSGWSPLLSPSLTILPAIYSIRDRYHSEIIPAETANSNRLLTKAICLIQQRKRIGSEKNVF